MSDRSYRDALGFYPTSNTDDGSEMDIFIRIKERAHAFLTSREIHSGNARVRMHDLYVFAWEETPQVFAYARASPGLARLFPSSEAVHSYIYSILFALVAEDSRLYEESKKKDFGVNSRIGNGGAGAHGPKNFHMGKKAKFHAPNSHKRQRKEEADK
jgi:hypothetical protein